MPPGTPFNIFKVRKKKPREKTNSPGEELALAKAAAWAWYRHGSGAEGKAITEFDATRSRRTRMPSRYKVEATSLSVGRKEISQFKAPSPVHRTSSSLLDNYEILSISKELNRFVKSSGVEFAEKLCVKDVLERQESWSSSSSWNSTLSSSSTKKRKSKNLLMVMKGFWVRPELGQVCGFGDDVDAGALVGGSRRRWPEGHLLPMPSKY